MTKHLVAAAAALVFTAVLLEGTPAPAGAGPRAPMLRGPSDPVVGRHPFPVPGAALGRLGAHYLGPAHLGNRWITVDVNTQLANANALFAYAHYANTPGSYLYRHWLAPEQIGSAFGTPRIAYLRIAQYFASKHLAVKTWKTRTALTVTGFQPQIESAFGTKLGAFVLGKERFFLPVKPLSVPAGVAITSIAPITNLGLRHTNSMSVTPPIPVSGGFSNARVNGATPMQLAEAYDLNEAYKLGYTGAGVNLGIVGTGPISLADVPNYKQIFHVPGTGAVTIVPAAVNGDTTPPPVTGPCTAGTSENPTPVSGSTPACNPEDEEAQLDTEQAASLAYNASVLFYLGYNANGCEVVGVGNTCVPPGATEPSQGIGLDGGDDEMMQAIDDNRADILSLSFGGCEPYEIALMELTPTPGGDATGTDPTLFAELAAEGIAVFVSSGDSGSAGCQRLAGYSDAPAASYPSTDPNVVSVGGTTTPIGADGRLTGPITNWGQQTQSGGAAGAGQSTLFQRPSFEAPEASTCTMRCQPDVALNADPFTGPAVLYDSGPGQGGAMEAPIGGTSASTPDTAAMWAVVLSACKVTPSCGGPRPYKVTDPVSGFTAAAGPAYRLGNPNFIWYPLTTAANATKYHQVFYDIVYGNDGVPSFAAQEAEGEGGPNAYTLGIVPGSVSAGPGWDQASGLGFPLGRQLIKFAVGV